MWCPLRDWVICQSHRHGKRIGRRPTSWRIAAIRSPSWSPNLGCLALNSRRKVLIVLADAASRWVTGALGGHGHLLPSHRKNRVILGLQLQKANGRQNLSQQNGFLCHHFGPNSNLLIHCHIIVLTSSSADLSQLNPLCSCGQRVKRALLLHASNCSAELSLAMVVLSSYKPNWHFYSLCLLLTAN